MQVCTSLQTDNHASTPPLSFLQAECPSCRPTNSVKARKANVIVVTAGLLHSRVSVVPSGPPKPCYATAGLSRKKGHLMVCVCVMVRCLSVRLFVCLSVCPASAAFQSVQYSHRRSGREMPLDCCTAGTEQLWRTVAVAVGCIC